MIIQSAGPALVPTADAPLIAGSTSKSMHEFGSCFVSIQEAQSRPSWFVPHERGGRISNEGTQGVRNPYQIRFTEADGRTRIEAFIAHRGDAQDRSIADAIKRCW
ncbi:MAG: hypothetical protein H0T82_05070 [Sphingomonas sp.]|nr:hypothetical protein [Sphingomonas sp.]